MLVFDDLLSENFDQCYERGFAAIRFCHFLLTFAVLGSFLADPGPPEANTTVRSFQILDGYFKI